MAIKDENIEQEIPSEWRESFRNIVDDIRYKHLSSKSIGKNSYSVSSDDAEHIYASIDAYGEMLGDLPEEAWETSVCRWMGNYWHALIDLFTVAEEPSDLVLFADVHEDGLSHHIQVLSVHVP